MEHGDLVMDSAHPPVDAVPVGRVYEHQARVERLLGELGLVLVNRVVR